MKPKIPLKLVETWFWMALFCKHPQISLLGKKNIKNNFGSIEKAIEEHPSLYSYLQKTAPQTNHTYNNRRL